MTATIDKSELGRRGRSLVMIDKLVDSRTEMLALYGLLAKQQPFNDNPDIPPILQEFCQSLVDYAAHAHFRLYKHFAEKNERRKEIQEVAEKIYPKILEVTNIVLDFNDKYDCEDHCRKLTVLEKDLSFLGEQLADRIELEDQLIGAFGYKFDG